MINRVSKITFFFTLAVLGYSVAAILTVADNGFQNGDEDLNMLRRGDMMYAQPATILEADETGRNNIAAYLLLGGLYRIFGLKPFYYYAILLGMHVAVALLWMFFSRGILDGSIGAAVAGLFFLVLSVHFQTIGWIENLGRVSMTLLSLLALTAFDNFRRAGGMAKILLVYGLWCAALSFAEEAFVFPFLVMAYDVLILRTNFFARPRGLKLGIYLPFVVVQVLFFLFQFVFYGVAMRQYITLDLHFPQKILGIFWTLANLIVPHREALAAFVSAAPISRVMIPFLIFAPLAYFFFRFGRSVFREHRFFYIALFCLFWFLITFSPYIFRPFEVSWKEYPHPRYLYWPMMGVSLFVGFLVQPLVSGVLSLGARPLRVVACVTLALAGIYFYALNVGTYCFMVEKLCAAGCVDTPRDLYVVSSKVAFSAARANHVR